MPPYSLKYMAEAGYVMGLATIGEVASHMGSHYDAYFLIENFAEEWQAFEKVFKGHEEDSIFKYLTDEDKAKMDDELEKAFAEKPREASDETEEEGEQENKHF